MEGGEEIDTVKKESESAENKGIAEQTFVEYKFTNQNWVKVLDEIWKYAPNRYGRGTKGYNDSHPLAIRLKITGYELGLISSFLEEQKLIEYDQQQHNWIEITPKGFDVALQNRNDERKRKVNNGSLFLGFAIAIFAATSLLVGIDDILEKWLITIMIGIALVVVTIVITKT